jgi:hypothetical protein
MRVPLSEWVTVAAEGDIGRIAGDMEQRRVHNGGVSWRRRSILSLRPEYGGSLGHVRGRSNYELRVGDVARLGLPDPLADELIALHQVATGEAGDQADAALLQQLGALSDGEFVDWTNGLTERIGRALGVGWVVRIGGDGTEADDEF